MSTPQDPWGQQPRPPDHGPPPEPSPWSRPGADPAGQPPPPPPGHPASGQPVPGQPGYPVPGQPVPGQPVPGQPVPGQPGPGPGQAPYGHPQGQFSYPGQQPAPARPRARTSRNVVLLVVGLVVATVLLVGVVGTMILRGDPRETAEEFMAALKSKDMDKAHSLLCADGRKKVTVDDLRGNFDLDTRSITGYALGPARTRERDGNSETLIPVTIDYDRGEQLRLDLGVWNDRGQKVCSLNPPDED